jgi:hypothetical protein
MQLSKTYNMKTYVISLLAIGLSFFFWGCKCERTTHSCINPIFEPNFVGYSITDIDTLVIRMYTANNGFTTLLDTFKIANGNGADSNFCYYYDVSNDTIKVAIMQGPNYNPQNKKYYCEIAQGYDWSIYIPATGQTDSISDFSFEPKTESYNNCGNAAPLCPNAVNSLKLNGTVIDTFSVSSYQAPHPSVGIYIYK